MARILKELEDIQWFPAEIRGYMTDYLQFLFSNFNLYSPAIDVIRDLQLKTSEHNIIDLCSGSGGPWETLSNEFRKRYGTALNVTLTDLYPNPSKVFMEDRSIKYHPSPVNALNVPAGLKGIRTMFSGLHHFKEEEIVELLNDTITAKQPTAFFDSGDKNILLIIAIIVFHPILLFILSPFIKPFSIRRLIFTYLMPAVVIGCIWDGVVSAIHLYTTSTLQNIISNRAGSFSWKVFTLRNRLGMRITCLTGIPD